MDRDYIIDTISDTHNKHGRLKLKGGDLLLHSGDISSRGRPEEIAQFVDWLELQEYTNIVWIPGNHDFGLEKDFLFWKEKCDQRGIHLLNDSGVTIDGIKIWGSPIQPWFHDWAFNRLRGTDIQKHWDLIPNDTEILITHGPPHGILDRVRATYGGNQGENVGCERLAVKIKQTNAKLHVFGHIHEARGQLVQDGVLYVNASSLDHYYSFVNPGYTRVIKDLAGNYKVQEETEATFES